MMTRFLLHNLTLPAEEETGYIRVWSQRRLNYLKHHRKVLYYNLLTSRKLRSHLANAEEQAQQLFSRLVNELAKKRRCHGATQSHQPNGVGAEDERYSKPCRRNRPKRTDPWVNMVLKSSKNFGVEMLSLRCVTLIFVRNTRSYWN